MLLIAIYILLLIFWCPWWIVLILFAADWVASEVAYRNGRLGRNRMGARRRPADAARIPRAADLGASRLLERIGAGFAPCMNPPHHVCLPPGRYRHTCPGCGATREFTCGPEVAL